MRDIEILRSWMFRPPHYFRALCEKSLPPGEAEGLGDENHRRTLCRRTLQELVRNPTRETTVESHPSKNQGWAPGTKSSPMVRQGNNLMNAGQKFNLDPRLLVQIARAETRRVAQPSDGKPHSGCPILRGFLRRVGGGLIAPWASLSRPVSPERNLPPTLIYPYWPRLVEKIEAITAPAPILRCCRQTSLHRIAVSAVSPPASSLSKH